MCVIGILGTIHNDLEYRKKMGYPIEVLEEAIKDFLPDVICGEVRPEDWEVYCKDKSYDGYLGPFEYRNLIIPLCEKHHIQFVPVDWFERDLINYSLDGQLSEIQQKNYEKEIMKIYDEIFRIAIQSKIPFNSFEFNELVKEKHKLQNEKEPIDNIVNWITRNYIMIARIKNAIENNKGKRILCTVGAEHNYFYYEELKKLGYAIVFPLK
jgi:hypothetical protein